jgi:hypothetical protein
VLRQQNDVRSALSQRRNMDGQDIYSEDEGLADAAAANPFTYADFTQELVLSA